MFYIRKTGAKREENREPRNRKPKTKLKAKLRAELRIKLRINTRRTHSRFGHRCWTSEKFEKTETL